MRSAPGVFLLLVFLLPASGLRAQDSNVNPTPTEPGPTRSSHSAESDKAVPLCPASFNDSLATDGIADRHELGVEAPRPGRTIPPNMSDESRRALMDSVPYSLKVMLSGVVGVDGRLQNVCLKRSAGYGLDATAAEGVKSYQFSPALKDGKPVPWRLMVGVLFRSGL